jgi:23S rRNA (cytosine1962-C5)-methyltransferase
VLRPQGTLIISSCSSRVAADDFFETVHHSAGRVGRPLNEIGRSGHPLDHPVGFAEGAYLKCLFAYA